MNGFLPERFRLIENTLEEGFASGRLLLLEVDSGYIFFTSDVLHKAYDKAGSGQWAEIPDRFFFALNYKAVEKSGVVNSSLCIELFDYGYKEERETFLALKDGLEGITALDQRKGYSLLYSYLLLEGKERKADIQNNNALVKERLARFLKERLPALEKAMLG